MCGREMLGKHVIANMPSSSKVEMEGTIIAVSAGCYMVAYPSKASNGRWLEYEVTNEADTHFCYKGAILINNFSDFSHKYYYVWVTFSNILEWWGK